MDVESAMYSYPAVARTVYSLETSVFSPGEIESMHKTSLYASSRKETKNMASTGNSFMSFVVCLLCPVRCFVRAVCVIFRLLFPDFPLSPSGKTGSNGRFNCLHLFRSHLTYCLTTGRHVVTVVFCICLCFAPRNLDGVDRLLAGRITVLFLLRVRYASRLNGLRHLVLQLTGGECQPLAPPYDRCRGGRGHGRNGMRSPTGDHLERRVPRQQLLVVFYFNVNFHTVRKRIFYREGRTRGVDNVISVRRPMINGRRKDKGGGSFSLSRQAAGDCQAAKRVSDRSYQVL